MAVEPAKQPLQESAPTNAVKPGRAQEPSSTACLQLLASVGTAVLQQQQQQQLLHQQQPHQQPSPANPAGAVAAASPHVAAAGNAAVPAAGHRSAALIASIELGSSTATGLDKLDQHIAAIKASRADKARKVILYHVACELEPCLAASCRNIHNCYFTCSAHTVPYGVVADMLVVVQQWTQYSTLQILPHCLHIRLWAHVTCVCCV